MSWIIHDALAGLKFNLGQMKQKVRYAVAGEVTQAIHGAISEVVQQLLLNAPSRQSESLFIDPYEGQEMPPPSSNVRGSQLRKLLDDLEEPSMRLPIVPRGVPLVNAGSAISAGVSLARWWLQRNGSLPTAAGLGLGIGILAVVGGPTIGTALAIFATAAEVLATPDALLDSSAQLEE